MRTTAGRTARAILLAVLIGGAGCGTQHATLREDPRIAAGRAMVDHGQYPDAERHFLALSAEARNDSLVVAQCRKWLGNIYLAYGKYDEAMRFYEDARNSLEHLTAGRPLLVAGPETPPAERRVALSYEELFNVLNNIAALDKYRGDLDGAETLHRRVLTADRARGDALAVAISLYNLGDIAYIRAERARRAGVDSLFRSRLHEAHALYAESIATHPTADAAFNLGNVLAREGDTTAAVAQFRDAESRYTEAGYVIHRAICLGNIGILEDDGRHDADAIRSLRRAIALIEDLRGSLESTDVRSSFIAGKYYLYEQLIRLLARAGRTEDAFEYVERAKARSFLDLIGSKQLGGGKHRTPVVDSLIDRENALEAKISAVVAHTDSSGQLDELLREHADVLDLLRESDPEYASIRSVEPVSVSALRDLLDDSTALVEYYVGDRSSYVFVVRTDGIAVKPLGIHGSFHLERVVDSLRRRLYVEFPERKSAFLRAALAEDTVSVADALQRWRAQPTDDRWQLDLLGMYMRLVAPIDSALSGVRTLYIVPHGPLHLLPFQALVPPSGLDRSKNVHMLHPRFLIDEYAIVTLPSASVLPFAAARGGGPLRSALVVGDPVYADPVYRAHPLAAALREADSVASYLPNPLVLTRAAAEERTVKAEMGSRDVVHFATHGELNKRYPLRSRILLAAAEPSGDDDGNLTVGEIFDLDLHASLVTLSACQTAEVVGEEGAFAPGDELVGMTRSFLYAGTASVIASLWYVDDAATLRWMTDFYRRWVRAGVSKAAAARDASVALMHDSRDPDWAYPYYWSAFILMGDGR